MPPFQNFYITMCLYYIHNNYGNSYDVTCWPNCNNVQNAHRIIKGKHYFGSPKGVLRYFSMELFKVPNYPFLILCVV